MPSIISTGAGSTRAFGNEFGGVFTPPNAIVFDLNPSVGTAFQNPFKTHIDTSGFGNVYIIGPSSTGSAIRGYPFIIKLNSAGNVLWSSEIIYASKASSMRVFDVTTDASGNVYVGMAEFTGFSLEAGRFAIFNSSGSLITSYRFAPSTVGTYAAPLRMTKDSSGNILLMVGQAGSGNGFIYKFTSPTTYSLFASYNIPYTAYGDSAYIACDSSDNVYILTSGSSTAAFYYAVAKISSTGTVSSTAYAYADITSGTHDCSIGNALTIDQNNNLLVQSIYYDSTSSNPSYQGITKINTSLAVTYSCIISLAGGFSNYSSPSFSNKTIVSNTGSLFATFDSNTNTITNTYQFTGSGAATPSVQNGANFNGANYYLCIAVNQTTKYQLLYSKIAFPNTSTLTGQLVTSTVNFTPQVNAQSGSLSTALTITALPFTVNAATSSLTITTETPSVPGSFASVYATQVMT